MQEPMFTVVRSSIQSADGQARTGAGWYANRLTRGRCASKISIRPTFRGRSTWPTRSGSRTIRIIILRTSREWREKVRPCYRGLFCAAGADTTSHYTTEGVTAANHTTFAVMRIANMVAPNVSRFQVRPWMRKSREWSLRHWSRIASQWRWAPWPNSKAKRQRSSGNGSFGSSEFDMKHRGPNGNMRLANLKTDWSRGASNT